MTAARAAARAFDLPGRVGTLLRGLGAEESASGWRIETKYGWLQVDARAARIECRFEEPSRAYSALPFVSWPAGRWVVDAWPAEGVTAEVARLVRILASFELNLRKMLLTTPVVDAKRDVR